MTETKSILAFFIGLVFFIVLIGLAIGRIKVPPKKTTETAKVEQIALTPTIAPTKKPGFLASLKSIFSKKTTPTPTPINSNQILNKTSLAQETGKPVPIDRSTKDTPNSELKQALNPKGINAVQEHSQTTKGGLPVNNIQSETIPETGTPLLVLPLSLLLGSAGVWLKKNKL